jgi:hypothetical protein
MGGGNMQTTLLNQGIGGSLTVTDDVSVELHDANFPYGMVYAVNTTIATDGYITCVFPAGAIGQSYYVVVKHRNTIVTWSALPVLMTSNTNYDFTTSATQAYGGNQINLGSGIYGFYSGDIDQDETIDALDYLYLDADLVIGNFGYLATDLTGDGFVDAFDYLILDPNLIVGISSIKP